MPLPVALTGCPPLPPEVVTYEEADACETTSSGTTAEILPTSGDGVHTVTGDEVDTSSGSTSADTDVETTATTDRPDAPPAIVDGVVIPDLIEENGLLEVTVTTTDADGVRMLLADRAPVDLTYARPGVFVGQIAAFTGLDNGRHTAIFTPSRAMIEGMAVAVDYEIALPTPGSAVTWDVGTSCPYRTRCPRPNADLRGQRRRSTRPVQRRAADHHLSCPSSLATYSLTMTSSLSSPSA